MVKTRKKFFLCTQEGRFQTFIVIILAILAFSCFFPLLYVLGMSFTSQNELLERNNFVIIPLRPVVSAYDYILGQDYFWNGLFITVSRTLVGTFATVLFSFIGGFVLAEKNLPFRKGLMIFVLIPMLISGGMIPSYLWMTKLGLKDNFLVFILPWTVNTYNILLLKTFIENLPQSLLESSEIDGVTAVKKMFFIVLPLSMPTIAAISVFTLVGHWNSWFDAMLYVNATKELYPLALIVRNLLTAGSYNPGTGGSSLDPSLASTPMGIKMASVVVGILPILVAYPALQRFFIHGMYMGAVKE